jgi:LacI family transcriptional regulator
VLAALVDAGLPPHESIVREHGDWSIDGGRAAARAILARADPPTAIFAFNDEMAIGALAAAAEMGLRVPEDLSVVGFDDVDRSQLVSPPLTTVRQPLTEMGRVAVSLVLRLVAGRKLEALRVELATRLVRRGSTAELSAAGR